jgi:hypothetical protein
VLIESTARSDVRKYTSQMLAMGENWIQIMPLSAVSRQKSPSISQRSRYSTSACGNEVLVSCVCSEGAHMAPPGGALVGERSSTGTPGADDSTYGSFALPFQK